MEVFGIELKQCEESGLRGDQRGTFFARKHWIKRVCGLIELAFVDCAGLGRSWGLEEFVFYLGEKTLQMNCCRFV